jgi:hypothetical protein
MEAAGGRSLVNLKARGTRPKVQFSESQSAGGKAKSLGFSRNSGHSSLGHDIALEYHARRLPRRRNGDVPNFSIQDGAFCGCQGQGE